MWIFGYFYESVVEGLGTDESSVLRSEVSVEDGGTEIVLGGIFEVSGSEIHIFGTEDGNWLESSPTNRKDQRILRF